MTSIEEKAEEAPEVSLPKQAAPGLYRLESTELAEADDLTPEEEFPEFGEFLEVVTPTATGDADTAAWRGATEFVSCPKSLARQLADHGAEEGTVFRWLMAQKVDGTWQVELEFFDDLADAVPDDVE